jgi:hypothetical protein
MMQKSLPRRLSWEVVVESCRDGIKIRDLKMSGPKMDLPAECKLGR